MIDERQFDQPVAPSYDKFGVLVELGDRVLINGIQDKVFHVIAEEILQEKRYFLLVFYVWNLEDLSVACKREFERREGCDLIALKKVVF